MAIESGVTLRTGRGAAFHADTIDISKGVIFDFRPFMDDYSSINRFLIFLLRRPQPVPKIMFGNFSLL